MGSAVKDTYENQWLVGSDWTSEGGECPRWSDTTGQHDRPPTRIVLPRGWNWCDDWKVDVSPPKAGKDGWVYGETLMAIRGNRGQSKPNPKWRTSARRRRWYRPCQQEPRGGEMSLEQATATLDEVALDLMAVKQHLHIVSELRPMLGTPEEDMGVRSGITHAASKAAGMHRKCTRRLARKPNFGALLSHVHDSGGKDAGGKDAGGVKAEAVVWPPPTEADAETKRTRVKGRWLAMQADAERLKPTVSRVFREVMALCGAGSRHAGEGAGGGSSDRGSTGRGAHGARGGFSAPRRRARDGTSIGSSISGDGSLGGDVHEAPVHTGTPVVPRADRDFSQLQDQDFCLDGELQVCNELAAERGKAVQQIAKDVEQTREVFEEVALIVGSRTEQLDAIERRARHAHSKTAEGVKHIERAHKDSPGCAVQ